MIEFVNLLNLELDMVDNYVEPPRPLADGEEIIGEVPDALKRVWTLWRDKGKATDTLKADIGWSGDRSAEKIGQVNELANKARFLEAMFWIALKDHFQYWPITEKSIGVRQGWKVVSCQPDPMDNMPPFFRQLFGGE